MKENVDLFIACLTDKCQVVGKEKEVKKEEISTNNLSSETKPYEPKEI